MEKVQAIGAPFEISHSSCSDLKPKTFEWTNDDCQIKVFIDGQILPGAKYIKKPGEVKVAWICESRAVFHSMHVPRDTWERVLESICDAYDIIFTSEKTFLSVHPKIQFAYAGSNLPWIKNVPDEIEKSKLVSLIASPKNFTYGHKIRHGLAIELQNNVDLYGGVLNSKRIEGVDRWDKSSGLVDYMFSFVIENDMYETYYTEKLTDCFMTATVPIYWGSPDIGKIFNTDGMIILTGKFDINTLNYDLYESKLEAIHNNYDIVQELEMADDYLYAKIKEFME